MGLALLADKLPAARAAGWGTDLGLRGRWRVRAHVDALAARLAAMPTARRWCAPGQATMHTAASHAWSNSSPRRRADARAGLERRLRRRRGRLCGKARAALYRSMNMAALSALQPVGVVGAGAMGAGIAQVAALAGHPVPRLTCATDAARGGGQLRPAGATGRKGKVGWTPRLAEAARRGAVGSEQAGRAGRLRAGDRGDCRTAGSQTGAVPPAGNHRRRRRPLGSNTSSISVTAIAAPLTARSGWPVCIFNPAR